MGAHSKEQDRRRRAANREHAEQADFHGINWDWYSHPALYDMVMKARPDQMGERAQAWAKLGNHIKDTTGEVQDVVQALLVSWRGQAAVSAASSSTRLAEWADEASHRATEVGARLVSYAEAVERAQKKMPPPEFAYSEAAFNHDDDVMTTGGPSTAVQVRQFIDDQKPDFEKARDAKAEAVRVMQAYATQAQHVHDTMPAPFDPGPSVTHPDAVVPTPPPPPPPPPPLPPQPPEDGRGGSGDPGNHDGTTPEGVIPTTSGQPGSGPGGPGSAGTPGYGTVGVPGADGTRGPGYPGGFGVGGPGVGAGGGPGARGGAGSGVRGGGGAGAEPFAARGGAAGEAGRLGGIRGAAGTAGAGGFYPPFGATGTQGDDDKEHRTRYVDGLDLLDDLPPAFPPVFGA